MIKINLIFLNLFLITSAINAVTFVNNTNHKIRYITYYDNKDYKRIKNGFIEPNQTAFEHPVLIARKAEFRRPPACLTISYESLLQIKKIKLFKVTDDCEELIMVIGFNLVLNNNFPETKYLNRYFASDYENDDLFTLTDLLSIIKSNTKIKTTPLQSLIIDYIPDQQIIITPSITNNENKKPIIEKCYQCCSIPGCTYQHETCNLCTCCVPCQIIYCNCGFSGCGRACSNNKYYCCNFDNTICCFICSTNTNDTDAYKENCTIL